MDIDILAAARQAWPYGRHIDPPAKISPAALESILAYWKETA